ncbi:MAG: ATP12 family protein [Kiloniellales bacterium]|nr:ATP12 family protein [Kiloniellales bacterium]
MHKNLKRFYKKVEVLNERGRYVVALDGRILKTPAKGDLSLPSKELASALAEEWDAQEDEVVPGSMAMMCLVSTALDNVAPNRDQVISQTADYGAHDLLCYWADQDQPELRRRQAEAWQPLLDWAALELDAPLKTTSGIIPAEQPEGALAALLNEVESLGDLELTGLAAATRASGSLLIGLALCKGQLDAGEAARLSQLDEVYQSELWGEDKDALQRRRALTQDLSDIERFLSLLTPPAR